ncbi:MarR family winged helix-turn-helix transcriptional regulator [Bacillus sp. B-jedd]|uniref:MarR family winged helix-turn-helix transcriptional regulator n=1 Tax=Bacillus sp. B-jedd TaxID=1476857 RepID=UPI000515556A|nr:MarR family transcriptional regulator [Bacillus sp. B-jedd]CEG26976.1 putative HTH-type transcriptional regulator ypoP [Bacillus sp. B-jedd]
MEQQTIQHLIDRYIAVSFTVNKKAETMIKEQIGSDLTNDQHYMLRYIRQKGECTSTELADVFEVNKSAITAIVTRLTEKGLVKRTRNEEDRRVVYLTLTEEGIDLFENAEQRIYALVESIITKFEPDEITAFIDTYEKLSGVLTKLSCKQLGE